MLARRGLVSIDADADPLLARFVDPSGAVVAKQPTAPDLAWLAQHSWAWDPARLDELIRAAAPATLYVCGGADNQQDIADRFTQVFLLEMSRHAVHGQQHAPLLPARAGMVPTRQEQPWPSPPVVLRSVTRSSRGAGRGAGVRREPPVDAWWRVEHLQETTT
ncbi:hypothetical protein [Kitasatospora sp. NPDC097691]|uniref:hypothetical protein n=1 Tax=Kitasatospora sp. NPDC097691 TaxID=3157231 RepID=UPI0033242707